MYLFMSGAIMMACWVAALCFLKFLRKTGDRLFAIFALAFFMMGLERLVLSLYGAPNEADPLVYVVRLLAFLLISYAVVDKNRARPR